MKSYTSRDNPHYVANFVNHLGAAHIATGQYAQAIGFLSLSLKMYEFIGFMHYLHNTEKEGVYKVVDYEKAAKLVLGTRQPIIRLFIYQDQPNSGFAHCLNNLGLAYKAKGDYSEAEKFCQLGLKMNQRIHRNEDASDIADSLDNIAGIYRARVEYVNALDHCTLGLEMKQRIHKDKDHRHIANSLTHLGILNLDKGDYSEAEKFCQLGLEMRQRLYPNQDHQAIADSYINLGAVSCKQKKYDEAIKFCKASLEIIYKGDHPNMAIIALYNLSAAYRAKGEYKQALEYISQALEKISVFPDHPYQNIIQNSKVEVTKLINSSTTNPVNNPSTSSNDNIDVDVSLLGGDSSATNQDLPPSP